MGMRHGSLGKVLLLVGVALGFGGVSGRTATADDAPTSLVDWLKAKGDDSSFEARRALFARFVGAQPYDGSAEQNVRLLAALRSPAGAARLGTAGGGGGGAGRGNPSQLRTVTQEQIELTYDLSTFVLDLELPQDVQWVEPPVGGTSLPTPPRIEEVPVLPTLPTGGSTFVCAALLSQKAKQFDDGLYAAVEEAFEGGADGKRQLLYRLRERLAAAGARDAGAEVVEAAARLGAVPGKGPEGIDAAVAKRLKEFDADARRSKPIGFYPWTDELKRVFRQDRMLQTALDASEARSVVEALRADPAALSTYRRMLRCYERLTNPYAYADLRPSLETPPAAPGTDAVFFLPPSRAHETELAKRLWGATGVPEGANLMDRLVEEVQAGKLSLEPTPTSGWYDRQTWSFESLLRPDAAPEASHLRLGTRYRAYLVELFKGLLALTRETHVKQLDGPGIVTMCRPQTRPLYVPLPFTVEPLPTHYARRADAYAFVRTVLDETFGAATVATLHRLTAAGPVTDDLATELTFLERLYRGAAEVSRSEIGAADAGTGPAVEADRDLLHRWAASLAADPDLSTDARMMVPVFHDLARNKTKVWVFLGWTQRTLEVGIATPPKVVGSRELGKASWWNGYTYFYAPSGTIYSPVVAEVYVTEILDRQEMRKRCDEGKTRSAILASLK